MTTSDKDPLEPVLESELLADPPGDALAPTPAPLRSRMLATTQSVHRFEELVAALADDADLPPDVIETLLVAIDDPSRWSPSPVPGVTLLHFEGGPKTSNAITGFVQIAVGHGFPEHDHGGTEIGVMMQGAMYDTIDGRTYTRGQRFVREPGNVHSLEVRSRIPAMYLTVSHVGVILDGELIGPDDSRL